MTGSQMHQVYISHNSMGALNKWRSQYLYTPAGAMPGRGESLGQMLDLAQRLFSPVGPAQTMAIMQGERVLQRDFMSFMYRDAKGIEPAAVGELEAERPFRHADVLSVPARQFAYLAQVHASALARGANPATTVHDVADTLIEHMASVTPAGEYYCSYAQAAFPLRPTLAI